MRHLTGSPGGHHVGSSANNIERLGATSDDSKVASQRRAERARRYQLAGTLVDETFGVSRSPATRDRPEESKRSEHGQMVTTRAWVACIGAVLGALPALSLARDVNQVTITEVGKSLENDEASIEQCKSFRPTVKQVRLYFSKAYPVPPVVTADRYYSPCYAEGRVTFSDGLSGTWRLYSSGAAGLNWTLGGGVNLLFRKNEWRDPFDGYDIR
jgi:hypothetical protein